MTMPTATSKNRFETMVNVEPPSLVVTLIDFREKEEIGLNQLSL
jgi:hypothetical protein